MTVFLKLAIFWVVTRCSENFTVTALNVALMISTVRLARNDDLEASDSIVQIGHLLGRNAVK